MFSGLVLLVCAYGTGFIHSRQALTAVTVGGWALLAGGVLYGGLVGAGHARERRAWQDYQEQRALVPVKRRLWLAALGVSARRWSLPVALLAAAVTYFWWKGRH